MSSKSWRLNNRGTWRGAAEFVALRLNNDFRRSGDGGWSKAAKSIARVMRLMRGHPVRSPVLVKPRGSWAIAIARCYKTIFSTTYRQKAGNKWCNGGWGAKAKVITVGMKTRKDKQQ